MRDFPHDCGTVDTYVSAGPTTPLLLRTILSINCKGLKHPIHIRIGKSVDVGPTLSSSMESGLVRIPRIGQLFRKYNFILVITKSMVTILCRVHIFHNDSTCLGFCVGPVAVCLGI